VCHYVSFERLDPGSFNVGLIGSTCTAPPMAHTGSYAITTLDQSPTWTWSATACSQGLALVQFSAQRKHVLSNTLGA